MKILYAVQGTGNGHITRSSNIIKRLKQKVDVDVLLSGFHNEIEMPFKLNYKLNGLGFKFGTSGGIDILETIKNNSIKLLNNEIKNLPIQKYDIVISDFEPVSVWAAKKHNIPSIGLSNQASILNPEIPKPINFPSISSIIQKNYAKGNINIGMHFKDNYSNTFTPVIRDEIRFSNNNDEGFGIVYLPFFSDEIIYNILKNIKMIKWYIFSKHSKFSYKRANISFEPISSTNFTEKLLKCSTVITAAGFATTS